MKYLERIRNLREDHDLTQTKVGEYLNISQRCYSHYEAGTKDIPIELLIKLANLYQVNLDYLVGRTDKKICFHLLITKFVNKFHKIHYLQKKEISNQISLFLERETGIEPATPSLARRCSTAEPLAHIITGLCLLKKV